MTFVTAAFGGVDMHGIQRNDSWTRLALTALPGDSQIHLESAMDWVVGDEIIIAPTGYKPEEVERFPIAAVSADSMTITLDGSLRFKHIGKNALILFCIRIVRCAPLIKSLSISKDRCQ